MITSMIGTIAIAQPRPENPSGVPCRFQCVATRGGSCGNAQTDMATASAAATRPNQRLRILSPSETGHEVPHDFLKDRSEEHMSELQSHSFISYAVFCLQKKT